MQRPMLACSRYKGKGMIGSDVCMALIRSLLTYLCFVCDCELCHVYALCRLSLRPVPLAMLTCHCCAAYCCIAADPAADQPGSSPSSQQQQ